MAAQAAAEKEVEESTSERSPHVERRLSFFDEAEEEWGKETPESLMTAILTLWHELHIPLSYRSRFYLGFKGKELFYFELEHRRLEWQRSQQLAAGNHRERDKAARALEVRTCDSSHGWLICRFSLNREAGTHDGRDMEHPLPTLFFQTFFATRCPAAHLACSPARPLNNLLHMLHNRTLRLPYFKSCSGVAVA